MLLLRELPDVEVPAAELECPGHRVLLVLEGCAGQVEMDLVRDDVYLLRGQEADPEPGVVARQERGAVSAIDHLPAQDTGPECRETQWVERIETDRVEVAAHVAQSPLPSQPVVRRVRRPRYLER